MTSETTTDWYRGVKEKLEERRTKTARKGPAVHPKAFRHSLTPLHFATSSEFMVLIDQAARRRNVNRSSYVRRAVAMLIARDLVLPVHRVLWETPCIGEWGKIQNAPGERDAGEGIENWCPHPGCRGEHLRLT